MWTKGDGAGRPWESQIDYCHNGNFGGFTGWRLSTQKENLQAYIDGIWSLSGSTKLNYVMNTTFRSATTNTSSPTFAWSGYLSTGTVNYGLKTANGVSLCIR